MLRLAKWSAVLALVLGLLLAAGALFIARFDWNLARPWLNVTVSQATGRPFSVEGELSVRWQWPQQGPETGWRRWLPAPTVTARQLVLGDPLSAAPPLAPASAPAMVRVEQVRAHVALLPLLRRQILVRDLVLTRPELWLRRASDGRHNWSFALPPASDADAGWRVRLQTLVIGEGRLALEDALKDLHLQAQFDTLPPAPAGSPASAYGLAFRFSGRHVKAPLTGSGQAGHILSLGAARLRFPLLLQAQTGKLQLRAEGVLREPAALAGMDLRVALSGRSMADLFPLTGLVLPETPPFQTSGRLVGSLKPEQAVWDYRDFSGRVGDSDLHGNLTYTSRKPRPLLEGTMFSRRLRLADLGPLIGANSETARRAKVLPNDAFATARWKTMDLDLRFSGEQIVRDARLPLERLSVHARLEDAVLTLAPLRFGIASGQLDSELRLDARSQPLKSSLRGEVRALKLADLFPKVALMQKSFGQMDGALALQATGDSVARMLGSSTGEVKLYVRDGVLSKQLLDLAALNLGSVLVSRLFGTDREVKLRCAVADLPVRDGLVQIRNLKLSTDEALVDVTGTANLATEQLDLHIRPESLGLKLLSLRTPLYARGSFADPQVGLEKGPLLLRAGAAVALAALSPVAMAALPVTVPGAEDDAQCKPLLAAAKLRPSSAAGR
ncbi:AsmA family protein [Ramlibacter sp. 2FC]|uniref:AsmA family protein n=1 Tax=Ramlibacter sp. 2FC TaxID=2502188 RepID=UPI0010F8F2E3|nr:AsmA family protein [Ramlibacter sp. 2FC]